MATPPATLTIEALPNELLQKIALHTFSLTKNSSLTALALVSRRFAPIAQEQLLLNPHIPILQIHAYLCALSSRPELFRQTTSVTLISTSKDRGSQPTRLAPPANFLSHVAFRTLVRRTTKRFIPRGSARQNWLFALNSDILPVLLGILLLSLPNLRALYLSRAWILDLPLLASLLTPRARLMYDPEEWDHAYLRYVVEALKAKLRVLDMPINTLGLGFPHRRLAAVFDLSGFEQLTEVVLPMGFVFCKAEALAHTVANGGPAVDPAAILPGTVRVLRLLEGDIYTGFFVEGLGYAARAQDKGGRGVLPRMRRLEVYHKRCMVSTVSYARRDGAPCPIADVMRCCREAEMELFLYFPSWDRERREREVGTWVLKEEGVLEEERREEEERWASGERRSRWGPQCGMELDMARWGAPFWGAWEVEVDWEGDVRMGGC